MKKKLFISNLAWDHKDFFKVEKLIKQYQFEGLDIAPLKIKNDWNVDGDQFYRRGMLVEGQNVRAVICFGKGLNVYEIQHKKGPRLRKERNYRLKLIDNPNEKKTYTVQTNHSNFPKFEQKVRFY